MAKKSISSELIATQLDLVSKSADVARDAATRASNAQAMSGFMIAHSIYALSATILSVVMYSEIKDKE